jgi:hypothetical protein
MNTEDNLRKEIEKKWKEELATSKQISDALNEYKTYDGTEKWLNIFYVVDAIKLAKSETLKEVFEDELRWLKNQKYYLVRRMGKDTLLSNIETKIEKLTQKLKDLEQTKK